MEISQGFSVADDRTVFKGKRSKRPRPSSSASSTYSLVSYSPATSSARSSWEEDEDMANCLILLARGSHIGNEPMAADAVKVRSWVYDCKTCGKSFPSFQALGGHRASCQKKSKPEPENIHPKKSLPRPVDTENYRGNDTNNKTRIHECSVCGSGFGSGQALGGHMRRHRPVPPNNDHTTSFGCSNGGHYMSDHKNVLAFDLNLPAPALGDDRLRRLPPPEQRPHLCFSRATVAALVDCHY